MLNSQVSSKLERISKWWEGKNDGRPLLKKVLNEKHNDLASVFSLRWESEKEIPDFKKAVSIKKIHEKFFMGESYPFAPHIWGNRGTPLTMAAYLGGKVIFRESTVWIEPVVKRWEDFRIKFDKSNHWVEMSRRLMERQAEEYDGKFVIGMPGLGDSLTCMSLLRGTENLLIDIVEKPDIIKGKITEFTEAWKQAHDFFYRIYRETGLPGDCSWLIWAPGKLCTCECDFSTMISPSMFESFVIPELEQLRDYAEYFIWHLDGYEEVRHLKTLLSLPYLKAVQIAPPPAGKPPCASEKWLSVINDIIKAGKSAYVYANNPEEVKTLAKVPSAEKLFIDGGIPGDTEQDVKSFLKEVFNTDIII